MLLQQVILHNQYLIIMSNFKAAVSQLLNNQYPNSSSQMIIINSLTIRFILPPLKLVFQKYTHLKVLVLTHCDMRNLENFPVFPNLRELDLSYNGLQGTLNHLIPLQNLQYLNLAHNYISDASKFLPLTRIKKVEIYIDNNPFNEIKSWKSKLKKIEIKFLTKPKLIIPEKPKPIQRVEKVQKQKSNYEFSLFQKELQRQIFLVDNKRPSNKVSFVQQSLKVVVSNNSNRQSERMPNNQVQSFVFSNSDQSPEEQQQRPMNFGLMDRMGLQIQPNLDYEQYNSEQIQELQELNDLQQDLENNQQEEEQQQQQESEQEQEDSQDSQS